MKRARKTGAETLTVCLALAGCGSTTHNPDAAPSLAGAAGSGLSSAGSSNASGAGGGGAANEPSRGGDGGQGNATGTAGSAGAVTTETEPPVDISGRWGMFLFEDPVGVELVESPDGTLTGSGCAAGAPGLAGDSSTLLCGKLSGTVRGHQATFQFSPTGDRVYSWQLTVSNDAERMTGAFTIDQLASKLSVAWLRVADDASWLERGDSRPDDALARGYALELIAGESSGDEFAVDRTYQLFYFLGALRGDLGAFWNSEISSPRDGSPLRVGPVPATASGLPVSLELDFDATGFTRVRAVTPKGDSYTFSATPLQ